MPNILLSNDFVLVENMEFIEKLGSSLSSFNKQIKKECKKIISNIKYDKLPCRNQDLFEITELDKWFLLKNQKTGNNNSDGWHYTWNRGIGDITNDNLAFPLVFNNKFFPNCRKVPILKNFLMEFSEHHPILMSGLSLLKPNCKIYPHTDAYGLANGMLTLNYCIISSGEGSLIVGDMIHIHKEGEYVLFDGNDEHTALNNSKDNRLILMISFLINKKKFLEKETI